MKLYTTCFLVILTIAATAQSYRWERIIGLPHRDEGITDLKEHYDKGYYLEAAHRPIGAPTPWGWQVKTDVNGVVLWDKTLLGVDHWVGDEVVSDEDGNRYVAGGMQTQQGMIYPFVAKFNACGENVWCRVIVIYNQPYGGVAREIVLNQNNQLIVLVRHSGWATVDKMYLAAFSLDGDFLFLNVVASMASHPDLLDPTLYHLLYHNNAYYLTGVGYYPKPGNPYHWFRRHLFVGLDSLFEEKFFLPYDYQGTTMYGRSFQSIPLNDTMLMAVGVHRIERHGTLIFYDIHGNEIGHCMVDASILYPGNELSQLTTIVRADDSLFIAAGHYEPEHMVLRNFEVVLDTSCLIYNFGLRPNALSFPLLIQTSDGNYLMGTSRRLGGASSQRDILLAKFDKNLQPVPFDTATYVYDTLCPYPIQSGNIDMSACMVIIVGEGNTPTSREYYARTSTIPIRVFPNPAQDNITFVLENTGHHNNIELRCFNLLGVLQYQTRVQRGQQQTTADVRSWPPGMYIVVTYSNGKPVGREKFVVRR